VYIFGLRLNMYIASVLAVVGAVWFYRSQRRPAPVAPAGADVGAGPPGDAGPAGDADPDGPAGHARPADPGDDSSPEREAEASRDSEQATSEP